MGFQQDLARSTCAWAEDGSAVITTALDHALEMARITNTVGKVIATKERLFSFQEFGGRTLPHVTPLGRELFHCCRCDYDGINEAFRSFRLNPLYHLLEVRAPEMTRGGSRILASTIDRANMVVEGLRVAAKSGDVKRMRANMLRTLKKSSVRIDKLVSGARAAHSKVLVVRMEALYRSKLLDSGIIELNEVTLEQVQKDRDAFIDYLTKGSFGRVLVGYAWRLEYGIGGAGWHVHFVAFFRGQRVRKDIMIGNILGRYWRDHITGGAGCFHTSNQKKEQYPRCGLGMFLRGDDVGWGYVRNDVMSYFEKADWYARVKVGPKVKLFGSGGPYGQAR